MYDIERFKNEKLLVEFETPEDFHIFIIELSQNGGLGYAISQEKFEEGFYLIGYRRYYWENNRLFAQHPMFNKLGGYSNISSDDLLTGQSAMQPSEMDVMSFLVGAK